MTTLRPEPETLVVLDGPEPDVARGISPPGPVRAPLVAVPPARTPSTTRAGVSWTSVLDSLEAHVDELETALTTGDLDAVGTTSAWPPPAGLGPMPREHLARARALQARQLRALDHLALALGDLRGTLSFVSAATEHAPARAFLDQSL
jgi:hypothetical protein